MKIKEYLASQAIRFLEPDDDTPQRQSPVPIINEFQNRYGFVQVPRTVAEIDLKIGVSFFHGYFKDKIIDKVQIYENGVLCEAKEDNALCDELIDDIFDWLPKMANGSLTPSKMRAYLSQLTITSSAKFSSFEKLAEVGTLISDSLQKYGQAAQPYGVSGFRMHYDAVGLPGAHAPQFFFERRAEQPYKEQLFFTSAPLRTDNHLEVIDRLEKILA